MHFCHSSQVWEQFPQLVPGILVIDGVHPEVDVEDHLQPWYQKARERLSGQTESQLDEISAWRRVYSQMGLKPTQYRSAAEALLRRFRREENLPRLHPLVDLCNAVSLAFALPVAVFDLDQVDSYLEVRHAKGIEEYLAFDGSIEIPPVDEIIFADASDQVHARRWTFRQSRRSVIRPKTTPRSPPLAESTTVSTRNCMTMSFFLAPRALRIPISRVRSVMLASMMFMIPIPPTRREMAAIEPRTILNMRWVSRARRRSSRGTMIS